MDPVRVERRREPRDPDTAVDWEQIVLRRMAGRIRSLPDDGAGDAPAGAHGDWEQAALRTLRRKVRALEPDE